VSELMALSKYCNISKLATTRFKSHFLLVYINEPFSQETYSLFSKFDLVVAEILATGRF